jgi:hypothetical protein
MELLDLTSPDISNSNMGLQYCNANIHAHDQAVALYRALRIDASSNLRAEPFVIALYPQ